MGRADLPNGLEVRERGASWKEAHLLGSSY